ISVPFSYRLHGFPMDYWRFTSSGLYEMLRDFPQKIVFSVGPWHKPAQVFAIARKTEADEFARAQERLRAEMQSESMTIRATLFLSALYDRGRDLLGLLLGRAHVSVAFFDPTQPGPFFFESLEHWPAEGASKNESA